MPAFATPQALLPELHVLSRCAERLQREAPWLSISDPDQASSALHKVYSPHRLSLHGTQDNFNMHLARHTLGSMELASLAFGAEVELEQAWTTDFVLVSTQLCGHSRINTAGTNIEGAAGLIIVDSPECPVTKRFSHDSWRLNLRIERKAIEALFAQLYDQVPQSPLTFLPSLQPGQPQHERWLALLHMVASQAGSGLSPQMLKPLEEMVMLMLLTELLPGNTPSVPALAPKHVRRAEEYMRAHLGEPQTLACIAQASGTSIRNLNAGFRQYRQTTPMRWLHEQRLLAIHHHLRRAAEHETVASIALHWGINHLGRLASDYQQRFGVSPSVTLRGH